MGFCQFIPFQAMELCPLGPLQAKEFCQLIFLQLGPDDADPTCILRLPFSDICLLRHHVKIDPFAICPFHHTLGSKDGSVDPIL